MAVLYSKYRCKSSSNIFHHSIWCVVSFFQPPLCNFVFYCCLAKDLLRGTPAVFPFDFSTGPLLIILHLSFGNCPPCHQFHYSCPFGTFTPHQAPLLSSHVHQRVWAFLKVFNVTLKFFHGCGEIIRIELQMQF